MADGTLVELAQRVQRLERENRRLKGAVVVLLLGVASLAVMGQARGVPKVLEAEQFVLRDAAGTVRARLGFDPRSAPYVTTALTLADLDGKEGATLQVSALGVSRIILGDQSGGSLRLSSAMGGSALRLHDANGTQRVWLDVAREGSSALLFSGPNGKSRLIAHLNVVGDRPEMLFFDKDDRRVWRAP